jgi:hypothetical protein
MGGQAEVLAMGRKKCGEMLPVLREQAHEVIQKPFGIGRPCKPTLFRTEFDYPLSLDFRDWKAEVLLAGGKTAAGRAHGRAPDADEGIFFCAHAIVFLKSSAAIYDRYGHLAIPFWWMCLIGR